MSAPGRPERESFEHQREGGSVNAPGRPERETFERQREGGSASAPGDVIVRAEGISKYFDVSPPWLNRVLEGKPRTILHAVDDVSFDIRRGETLSLVGESGCGKSTVARVLVGLYAPTRGRVEFFGRDLREMNSAAGRVLRQKLQMIFQDPYASLNPRWRVADIIAEPLRTHGLMSDARQVTARVDELLGLVRLSPADKSKYPHQFSGGQRQRISIARALATHPEFLVCDEPTSALDVSVQAQVLNLMKDLQRDLGLTYLFISHNLAVVHHISPDRRTGAEEPAVRGAQPPVHPHAARRDSRPRHDRPRAHAGRRRGAEPAQSAAGLHLPSALSARQRALPARGAGAEAASPCGRRGDRRLSRRRGRPHRLTTRNRGNPGWSGRRRCGSLGPFPDRK